jgi:nucleoside-diphosphate-sugar epimerase
VLDAARYSFDIHAVVRKEPDKRLADVSYHIIDFAMDWMTSSLPDKVDTIIHLAQSSQFRDFPKSALDIFRVNIESTGKLLDYASRSGASRFIYASSGGVYGKGGVAFTENSPIAPLGQLGYYLGSKMCSEILAQSYASLMHVVVLRPFFIYGPGQNRTMLIPRLMDNLYLNRPITLQGIDGIRINPVHVKDASAAVIAAIFLNHSATFNIAGPDVLSIREICESMGEFINSKPIFTVSSEKKDDLIGDNRSMCEKLVVPHRRLFDFLIDVVAV